MFLKNSRRENQDIKKSLNFLLTYNGGVRGVMVIVDGNGHGDTSSNPE